jgi:hypothetical protein
MRKLIEKADRVDAKYLREERLCSVTTVGVINRPPRPHLAAAAPPDV